MTDEGRAGGRFTWQRLARAVALLPALAALLVGASASAQQTGGLKLTPSRLTLDAGCNARDGVSLTTVVRNDTNAPVKLAPTAVEPANKTAGKVPNVQATATAMKQGQPVTELTLAAGESADVRIDVKGFLDTGEWDVEVRNAGLALGSVTIVSPAAGTGVKVDLPATPPELLLRRGQNITIPLRNDDGVKYVVAAQMTVRGRVQAAMQPVTLAPGGGSAELQIGPPKEWFDRSLRTLFKDDVTTDSRLMLQFGTPACPPVASSTARAVPVKATLAAWSDREREKDGTGLLILVLVAGGVFSVLLDFFVPSYLRRRSAKAQLGGVARQIESISTQTDSRVRIAFAVERRQIADRLRRLHVWGQFAAEMSEVELAITRLQSRIDVLGKLELALARYWRLRQTMLPNTLAQEIEEERRQIGDVLRRLDPTDADIQAALAGITRIKERLDSAGRENQAFAERLVTRIASLQKDYDAAQGSIGVSPAWAALRKDLADDFSDLLGASAPTAAAQIAPPEYARVERRVITLELVRAFLDLCGARGANGAIPQEHAARREILMLSLRGGTWDQLRRAQRIVRIMREGIFHQQVEDEISADRVAIRSNRSTVRQFESAEFRVVFNNQRVAESALLEDYTITWKFDHIAESMTGFSVSQFFPQSTEPDPDAAALRTTWQRAKVWVFGEHKPVLRAGRYKATVSFLRDDGKPLTKTIEHEIPVRPPLTSGAGGSAWVETLRLSLALAIAAAALVVGARDQVLKLDLVPALIAVFFLGFGSDRIKNLFVQQQPAKDPAAKP